MQDHCPFACGSVLVEIIMRCRDDYAVLTVQVCECVCVTVCDCVCHASSFAAGLTISSMPPTQLIECWHCWTGSSPP